MYDFHNAVGQYIVYRDLIELTEPDYTLYLAINDLTHDNFFQRTSIQAIVNRNHLKIVVIDVERETIKQWIN